MQPMRSTQPLKHQEGRNAAGSLRSKRTPSRDAHGAGFVDDVRLLRAIRGLDDEDLTSQKCMRLAESLAFFLEFLLLLERKEDEVATDAFRKELETICEARILGCLQRFVQKRKHVDATLTGCCDQKCVQRLVSYTLVCILYTLSREARMAAFIVKNDLHRFLVDVYSESLEPTQQEGTSNETPTSPVCGNAPTPADPRDLLLSIDPFDWCYQSTCARMVEEGSEIFFIPVGVRSLIYLLSGEALPTDEITEHDKRSRYGSGSFCPAPAAKVNKKKQQLPSIFAFPTEHPVAAAFGSNSSSFQSALCTRRSDPVFHVAQSTLALRHMASRALVALVCNLRRPSPERRALLHDGRCIRSLLTARVQFGNEHEQRKPRLERRSEVQETRGLERQQALGDPAGLLAHQTLALRPRFLSEIAHAGLSCLHTDELQGFLKKCPQFVEMAKRIGMFVGDSAGSPQNSAKEKKEGRRKASSAATSRSLADRLKAATEASRRELAETSNKSHHLKRALELERSHRRYQLRSQVAHLEQLRQQLHESLLVMRSGRPHANPDQSFMDWMESLPTIEKRQLEQNYREEMRQRQIVETQFQREEARKKRQRECALMQQNDVDAPNEAKNAHKERKRLEFLGIQAEMRLLQRQEAQARSGETGLLDNHILDHHHHGDDDVLDMEAKMLQQEVLTAQRKHKQRKQDEERQRLLWVQQRKREAKELERMAKEDLYYVEKLLRAKQLEHEKQTLLLGKQPGNPIDEQQKKIERMRQLDHERKLAAEETEHMRFEDLCARQLRYLDAELRQLEAQKERNARRQMELEERECHLRWKLVFQAQRKAEEAEAKRLRVEARQQQREWRKQKEYESQVLAAWVHSWDEYGNIYYYNQLTGVSQWEPPSFAQ